MIAGSLGGISGKKVLEFRASSIGTPRHWKLSSAATYAVPFVVTSARHRLWSCRARRLPSPPLDSTKGRCNARPRRRDATRRMSMRLHDVRVHSSKDNLPREDQLAWKIAAVAADKVAVEADVAEMIVNRIIDNASVAIAAINRHSAVSA